MSEPIQNRGTGAGGANTNKNGLSFEAKTENESRLLASGFIKKQIPGYNKNKYGFYLEKIISPTQNIIYLTQSGLKMYFAHFHKKEVFREPDEAYIYKNGESYMIKILEKKNQNVEGSVDTKLLSGIGFIEEYSICLGDNFKVSYAFCISDFLKKKYISTDKKYEVLRKINQKYNIQVFFGDDLDYYTKLDAWLSS